MELARLGALIHRGTQEECDRMCGLLSAVAYSGDRQPIIASYLVVTEAENYEEVPA